MAGRYRTTLTLPPLVMACVLLIAGCALPDPKTSQFTSRVPVYNTHSASNASVLYFPDGVNVPAVIYAAREELERRGYSIEESQVTLDRGLLIAKSPDARLAGRIVVGSRLLERGADLDIRVQPRGNEDLVQDLLERIVARLGF